MKIFNKYWFSTSSGFIGIVTGEDQYTKIKKAYIKVVTGADENYDAKDVMENGSPVPLRIITDILRDLKMKLYMGKVLCPSWLDIPLIILGYAVWLAIVVGLALSYSWWFFLLLFLVYPKFRRCK